MLQRILPSQQRWPLHDTAATRLLEAAAQGALPAHALIERAGLAVARLALAIAPHARSIWVAAGGGNNGGDGMIAARHLAAAGKTVCVSAFGDAARRPADAQHAYVQALAAGVSFDDTADAGAGADLVIDALLGIGVQQAPRPAIAAAIERVNACATTVLAIDLPSGLSADTGSAGGGAAVRAHHTLSLLTLKPGLFTADGRDHAGRVWFDDLGLPAADPAPASAHLTGPPKLPDRRHAQHKGSFGDVVVIGGAAGMGGAALLAARSALVAGAGRVYLVRLDGAGLPIDTHRPELMPRSVEQALRPGLLSRATVVCGCGGGQAVAPLLPAVLADAARLVIDADALNALAASPALQAMLAARGARQLQTVLTPHPLEAARLLGATTAQVQADRLGAARRLAEASAATIVLKGSGTVLAAPGCTPWINPTGNARLGTAGTGDVLAGWIAGLWAAQPDDADATAAALAAAWLHGRAAEDGDSRWPLAASDLIDALTRSAS